jgi:mono/diheme cytochrome c family protein
VFASDILETNAPAGSSNVVFQFRFTNTLPERVTMERVHASCGCTTPRLPPMPWVLEPGTNAGFEVVFDLRGKRGQLNKMIYVYTDKGFKALTIRAKVEEPSAQMAADRVRNMQLAQADRQAVFREDCARCHADPAQGRQGRDLFEAVCGVCHDAPHRAEMVPDLRTLRHGTGEEHWRQWITHGKAGTLMPAFAQEEGGPLTREQIESLVDYLVRRFPSAPASPGSTNAQPAPAVGRVGTGVTP